MSIKGLVNVLKGATSSCLHSAALKAADRLQVLARKRRLQQALGLFDWMLEQGVASEHTFLALLKVRAARPSPTSVSPGRGAGLSAGSLRKGWCHC